MNLWSVWKWAALLIVTAIVIVPLLATLLGGFKSLGELRTDPVGLPDVWVWQNYWEILASWRYWELLFNSLWIAGWTVALDLGRRVDGRLRLRASPLLRARHAVQLPAARADVPVRDGDPAALHQGARPRASQHALGRDPAAGRLRARRQRASPAQRLPPSAGGTARRRARRRLRLHALLLPRDAAALAPDPRDRRDHLLRGELEQLPAAARRAELRGEVSLAARA